jgi:hypothetical protein
MLNAWYNSKHFVNSTVCYVLRAIPLMFVAVAFSQLAVTPQPNMEANLLVYMCVQWSYSGHPQLNLDIFCFTE